VLVRVRFVDRRQVLGGILVGRLGLVSAGARLRRVFEWRRGVSRGISRSEEYGGRWGCKSRIEGRGVVVDPCAGAGWEGCGVSEMGGVVPRRRDCLGESRGLAGGRSMSRKGGGGGGREEPEVEAVGKDGVEGFTFLRYRRIRDGIASTGTRRAMGILLI
jgi:hypothetical protein